MCANDIPQEDLIDCNTCYRCLKKFCQTCSPFLNPQIPVSSMYWYNDEYEESETYIYCEPKCRALHHWHMAARRYTEAVQWRAYQHLLTLKPYTLSLGSARRCILPGISCGKTSRHFLNPMS